MERIKVLLVEPMEEPKLIEIEHTLENLQELVGGDLQAVYPWEDPVAVIVCDDDGKYKGYIANRILADEDGKPYDLICGPFFICGLTTENFGSISDELAKKYTEMFRFPEMFLRGEDGKVFWCRLGSGEEPKIIG